MADPPLHSYLTNGPSDPRRSDRKEGPDLEDADAAITVWLVEDDAMYRETLVDLISEADGLRVGRAFGSSDEAVSALGTQFAPEVVLMDIGLPGMSGIEGARRLQELSPATQVVMLTVHEDDHAVFSAICAGASGYLLKNATAGQIVSAVKEVHRGGIAFTPPVARKVLRLFQKFTPSDGQYGLTEREKQILQLMEEGHTRVRIAEELHLSAHTVDTHIANIYAKLHVHSGIEAVAKAIRERVI